MIDAHEHGAAAITDLDTQRASVRHILEKSAPPTGGNETVIPVKYGRMLSAHI